MATRNKHSDETIARIAQMGMTRNTIIGICYRKGIRLWGPGGGLKMQPRKPKPLGKLPALMIVTPSVSLAPGDLLIQPPSRAKLMAGR